MYYSNTVEKLPSLFCFYNWSQLLLTTILNRLHHCDSFLLTCVSICVLFASACIALSLVVMKIVCDDTSFVVTMVCVQAAVASMACVCISCCFIRCGISHAWSIVATSFVSLHTIVFLSFHCLYWGGSCYLSWTSVCVWWSWQKYFGNFRTGKQISPLSAPLEKILEKSTSGPPPGKILPTPMVTSKGDFCMWDCNLLFT